MKASNNELRREQRINVEFPYDKEIVGLIKQIAGARWDPTLIVWHLPNRKFPAFSREYVLVV